MSLTKQLSIPFFGNRYSLAKYQQLEVAGEESRRFQTVSGEDLTRLLAQTHTFVLACHPEQIRLGSDLCEC